MPNDVTMPLHICSQSLHCQKAKFAYSSNMQRTHAQQFTPLHYFSSFLHQLHHFLRNVRFNNSAGEEIFFDENGKLATGFDIVNTVTFLNLSFCRVEVGKINCGAPEGKEFTINESAIVWNQKFNQVRRILVCIS